MNSHQVTFRRENTEIDMESEWYVNQMSFRIHCHIVRNSKP
jgi:hypothetical protein